MLGPNTGGPGNIQDRGVHPVHRPPENNAAAAARGLRSPSLAAGGRPAALADLSLMLALRGLPHNLNSSAGESCPRRAGAQPAVNAALQPAKSGRSGTHNTWVIVGPSCRVWFGWSSGS